MRPAQRVQAPGRPPAQATPAHALLLKVCGSSHQVDMLKFFLLLVVAALLPPSVRGTRSQLRQPLVPHLGFMTSYSFNPPLMKGWVTHGLDFCALNTLCKLVSPHVSGYAF